MHSRGEEFESPRVHKYKNIPRFNGGIFLYLLGPVKCDNCLSHGRFEYGVAVSFMTSLRGVETVTESPRVHKATTKPALLQVLCFVEGRSDISLVSEITRGGLRVHRVATR